MAERFIDQAFRAQVNSNPPEHPFPPHERVSIPPPTTHQRHRCRTPTCPSPPPHHHICKRACAHTHARTTQLIIANLTLFAFRFQVEQAMTTVKRLLSNARAPALPSDVSHAYHDK